MITLKTPSEIEILRQGGKKLKNILKDLARMVKPDITTASLEEAALIMIKKAGGEPSFKGYKPGRKDDPYPTALCASINHEVVHAPSLPNRILCNGDIIGLDLGLKYQGLYTDAALTVPVGKIDRKVELLIEITKQALNRAIKKIKPGISLAEIGKTIQKHAEAHKFSVVRDLVGHGVGYAVHEAPQIPNYFEPKLKTDKIILRSDMVLALEPMINLGSYEVILGKDNFTIMTRDHSLSAHFEHTVVVTKNGYEVLT